jgi:hypothetical protein
VNVDTSGRFAVAAAAVLIAVTLSVRVARTAHETAHGVPITWQVGDARILVGPNVHVSAESDGPYGESSVAAHPTDPNTLMGIAYELGAWQDRRPKLWVSRDRGQSWDATYVPPFDRSGYQNKGDPIVAFGATGTMLVAFPDVPVRRSDDGGKTWTAATRTDQTAWYWGGDREKLGADWSNGKYRGRIYHITNNADSGPWKRPLLRSSDDGRTFEPGGGLGWQHYVHVLSDGTVVVLASMEAQSRPPQSTQPVGTYLSSDGGSTFRLAGSFPRAASVPCDQALPSWVRPASEQHFTVDNGTSSRFRDRIYRVFPECRNNTWRVGTTFSADRGATWSEPKLVSPTVPAQSQQFLPAMAVNRDGTVMVVWHDTRNSERQDSYHLYASASVDGGETFLPAVRVSSAETKGETVGNLQSVVKVKTRLRAADSTRRRPGETEIYVQRVPVNEGRYAGEYVGLTADAGGVFHPFWLQSRYGTFHVYSTQLRVVRSEREVSSCSTRSGPTRPLKTVLHPEVDNAAFDTTFAYTQIPVRL